MQPRDTSRPKTGNHVLVLVLSASAAIAFLVAGGYTVFSNMQHTEEERAWVDHSQSVLNNLQGQTARLDRVDYSLQLYEATSERTNLRSALAALTALSSNDIQLQELIKDNESQLRHVAELDKTLHSLESAASRAEDANKSPVVQKELEHELLDYRNELGLMQQEERGLLRQRSDSSKASSSRSFLTSLGSLGFSLVLVLVLFVFLYRDALRQRQDEKRLLAAKGELEATVQKLTERAEESELLTSARDELQLCTTAQQAQDTAVRHMELLLPGTAGATLIINNSRSMVEIAASWGGPTPLLDGFDPAACCGLRAGKPRWRKKGKSELDCAHFAGKAPEYYLCVPLAAHGETLGFVFISCMTPEVQAIAEERAPLIQEMVELASLTIASLNLRAKLEGQSVRDGLTGLFNRHFMEVALERELHRAERQTTSLAVLMMDVDHFKLFNDTMGHEAGDIVLREVADCYRKILRAEDILCRYGGEEFVVIMPDATEETALWRAETIRRSISELRVQFHGEPLRSITVSVGVAMYPDAATDGGTLLRLADGALYAAKHAGRNQVKMAPTMLAA